MNLRVKKPHYLWISYSSIENNGLFLHRRRQLTLAQLTAGNTTSHLMNIIETDVFLIWDDLIKKHFIRSHRS